MAEAGVKVSEVATRNLTASTRVVRRRWLSPVTHATAAFALNDELAIGVISGLNAIGIKVPEQMSVIGSYDDTDYEFFRPALTTIEQPVWDIAKAALTQCLSVLGTRRATTSFSL